jgi:hypothetical protein
MHNRYRARQKKAVQNGCYVRYLISCNCEFLKNNRLRVLSTSCRQSGGSREALNEASVVG